MQTEVETAVRERLPIMTILLNNSRMGGYDHHMPAASARFGSNRLSGHYAGVVAAIGRGITATRAGHPVVLEMITKTEALMKPTWPSGKLTALDEW